jgi:hypothetical protein
MLGRRVAYELNDYIDELTEIIAKDIDMQNKINEEVLQQIKDLKARVEKLEQNQFDPRMLP